MAIQYLTMIVNMALQFIVAPLVLARAGQSVLGAYGLILQVVGYFAILDLGFGIAASRFLAQSLAYENPQKRIGDILMIGRSYAMISGAVVLLGLSVTASQLHWVGLSGPLAHQTRLSFLLIGSWTVMRVPFAGYVGCLNAMQRLALANGIGLVSSLVRFLATVFGIMAGWGLVGLVLANVAAEVLTVGCSVVAVHRIAPAVRVRWVKVDKALSREMLAFGGKALIAQLGNQLIFRTDNIVVGSIAGPTAVARYYATQAPMAAAYALIFRLAENASPAAFELHARQRFDALIEAFSRLHRMTLLLSSALAIGYAFLIVPFMSLWVGPAQYAGPMMSVPLAAFAVVVTATQLNGMFLTVTGQIGSLGVLFIVEGIVNLLLSIWLGHVLGFAAVMIPTVVCRAVTLGITSVMLTRFFRLPVRQLIGATLARQFVASLPGMLVLLVWTRMAPVHSWLGLFAAAATFLAVHGVVSYNVGLVSSDRSLVRSLLLRVRDRSRTRTNAPTDQSPVPGVD